MALISPRYKRLNAAGIIVLTLLQTEPHPISLLLANQTGDPGTGTTSLMGRISRRFKRLNAAGIIVLTLSHTELHAISPLFANQTGDPGTGKTSLMGRISRRYERLNAAGFIVLTHFAGVGTLHPHLRGCVLRQNRKSSDSFGV